MRNLSMSSGRGRGPRVAAYSQLSLRDLLEARALYHLHLMHHRNVVATAVGYYRIRRGDSWPNDPVVVHGREARTLSNSEVRPYSWPAVLVFVDDWIEENDFGSGGIDPAEMVPKTLFFPDGRTVPVCVIEAPRDPQRPAGAVALRRPLNNIGAGSQLVVDVQGRAHVATVGCLVSDGHRAYAVTNRHVAGDAGGAVSAVVGGHAERVGVSSAKQLTRLGFAEMYPGWPGADTFVNVDLGLVDLDDVTRWTAKVDGATVGPMVDVSVHDLSLELIGRQVRGVGAASGVMLGEIHALFYRYESRAGSEYVADLFIGPRTGDGTGADDGDGGLLTRPGDSGALWLLEPDAPPEQDEQQQQQQPLRQPAVDGAALRPLALQWGADRLVDQGATRPYVLATFLSRALDLLGVELVRDWNLDELDTWGAVGHFSIAARAFHAVSARAGRAPTLQALMRNNLAIISHDDATLESSNFTGQGSAAFVPMADVPDFFWKPRLSKQGHARPLEGPNHFADMDQPRPSDGATLLDLCTDTANIDPDVWNAFYDEVRDGLSGEPISMVHRGLLPFRVWQIFDAMVGFARDAKPVEFVCAAGVLAHYVGDACQPLHISFLHDGDPARAFLRHVNHRDGTSSDVPTALGAGVHSAYEDAMVNANRVEILASLATIRPVAKSKLVRDGEHAARAVVAMMRSTFAALPPADIVQAYVDSDGRPASQRAAALWDRFGAATLTAMDDGCRLLGALWEAAWTAGNGEVTIASSDAVTVDEALAVIGDASFLPSVTIDRIGALLQR